MSDQTFLIGAFFLKGSDKERNASRWTVREDNLANKAVLYEDADENNGWRMPRWEILVDSEPC